MDKRKVKRLEQVGLPGVFRNCENDENFASKITNISEKGLGISSYVDLNVGTAVELTTLNGNISFEIQWKTFNDSNNKYLYGLICTENAENLQSLVSQSESPLKTDLAS